MPHSNSASSYLHNQNTTDTNTYTYTPYPHSASSYLSNQNTTDTNTDVHKCPYSSPFSVHPTCPTSVPKSNQTPIETLLNRLQALIKAEGTDKTADLFTTQREALAPMYSNHDWSFITLRLEILESLILSDLPSRVHPQVCNIFKSLSDQPTISEAPCRSTYTQPQHVCSVQDHKAEPEQNPQGVDPSTKDTGTSASASPMDVGDDEHCSNKDDVTSPRRSWIYHTFNINGLKHFVKDGHLRAHLTIHRPDILCLQEIKTRRDKLDKMRPLHSLLVELGYPHCYYSTYDAPNTGLHGTAMLCKHKPSRVIYGWAHSSRPEPEGRVITAVFDDHAMTNVYVPSSGIKSINMDKHLNFMDDFTRHFRHLQSSLDVPVFATGDFNAIMTDDDWYDLHQNEERHLWPSCTKADRDSLSRFLSRCTLSDAWSMKNPHSKDGYTFFEYNRRRDRRRSNYHFDNRENRYRNRGGRIDYLFGSEETINSYIRDIWLCRDADGSDHIPLCYRICTGPPDTPPSDDAFDLASCMSAFSTMTPETTPNTTQTPFGTRRIGTQPWNTVMSTGMDFEDPLPWDQIMDDDSELTQEEKDRLEQEGYERNADAVRSSPTFNGSNSIATGLFADVSELRISRIITASVPMSAISVREHTIRALWDSGASFCCLGLLVVRMLYGDNYKSYCRKDAKCPVFELADGSRSAAEGCISVPLSLRSDGVVTWQEFFILPTESVTCILGVDIFCRFGALLDFGRSKQVTLPLLQSSLKFPFRISEQKTIRGSVAPLFAPYDVTLNPADEVTFAACLSKSDFLRNASPLIGRVTRAFRGVDPRHCCANVVTTLCDGRANITIGNITGSVSILRRGSIIGYFRHADVVRPDDPILNTPIAEAAEQYRLVRPTRGNPSGSLEQCIPEEHRRSTQGGKRTEEGKHGTSGETKSRQQDEPPADLPPKEPPPDGFTIRIPLKGPSIPDSGDRMYCKPLYVDEVLKDIETRKVRTKIKTSPLGSNGLPTDLDLTDAKENLTADQYSRLVALLARYNDCFAREYGRPKKATGIQMTIDIPPGTPPVWRSTRRWNPKRKLMIIDFTERLLDAGIIEPTDSDWNSNLFCVPKADGSPRLVQDLTGMNAVTRPVRSTLPMINECLEGMGGSHFFSVCDLDSAYHSLDLHPDSRKYTAFTTPLGRFQWTRAVMGARSSQEFLCRITQKMLAGSGLLWSRVAIYSDDICCYSPTFDEHLEDLEKLLSGVRSVNLTLSAKKCKFASKKVSYCGFIIDEHGIHADPKSCEAIRNMPIPKDLKTLRAFLGACSWWRRFIPRFAKVVEPLRPLLQKGGWRPMDSSQLDAIQSLKDALCSPPILAHPNFDLPFELHCDGSPTGIGCALIQVDPVTGKRIAVSYFSKSLSPPQKKYAQFEIEALSVLTGLEVYRSYFAGEQVKIFTDSLALKQLLNPPVALTGRRCRWYLRISEFDYSIEHRSGKHHVVPDLLSRLHNGTQGPDPGFEVDPYVTMHAKHLVLSPSREDILTRDQQRCRSILQNAQNLSHRCASLRASLQQQCSCDTTHRPSCIHARYRVDGDRVFSVPAQTQARPSPGPRSHTKRRRIRRPWKPTNNTRQDHQENNIHKHTTKSPPRGLTSPSWPTPNTDTTPSPSHEFTSTSHSQTHLFTPTTVQPYPLCSALPPCVKLDLSKSDAPDTFVQEQARDPTCQSIRLKLSTPCACLPYRSVAGGPSLPPSMHFNTCIHAHHQDKNGLLYWVPPKGRLYALENSRVSFSKARSTTMTHSSPRVYVPESLRTSVLYYYHGLPISGHVGREKTISNISRRFYWKGLHKQTAKWIRACIPCNRRKAAPKAQADEPGTLTSRFPMDVLCIDHVGPLFESTRGNTYLLTAIDVFTRFPFAIPVPDRKAETVARALYEHIFQLFSFPSALVSDNAPEFVGKVMTALCNLFNIKHIRTLPFTPMLNSCLERFHRFLNATLTMLTNRWKNDWDDKLPSAMIAYRTSTHATLRFSPFQVLFGRSPTLDMDVAFPPPTPKTDVPTYVQRLNDSLQEMYTELRESQSKAQAANLARRSTSFKERLFNKNDFVFVSAHHNAEVLPSHLPRIQKLLDRNSDPSG